MKFPTSTEIGQMSPGTALQWMIIALTLIILGQFIFLAGLIFITNDFGLTAYNMQDTTKIFVWMLITTAILHYIRNRKKLKQLKEANKDIKSKIDNIDKEHLLIQTLTSKAMGSLREELNKLEVEAQANAPEGHIRKLLPITYNKRTGDMISTLVTIDFIEVEGQAHDDTLDEIAESIFEKMRINASQDKGITNE